MNWHWVHLNNISTKIHYGYTASALSKGNAKLLRITDIQNKKVDWSSVPYCDILENKLEKLRLVEKDILIARTGGTIGKSYIINYIPETSVFASYLIRVQLTEKSMAPFVKEFIDSPNYWIQLQKMSMGTGQPNVNASNLSTLLIPLPPINEQVRIVQKIAQLNYSIQKLALQS